MVDIIRAIRRANPDCAITLSFEKRATRRIGLNREAGATVSPSPETANEAALRELHPAALTLRTVSVAYDAQGTGFQVGCGLMVVSPYQTTTTSSRPEFVRALYPECRHRALRSASRHPVRDEKPGTMELTLFLLVIMPPDAPIVLLPRDDGPGDDPPTGR
jgi:biotin synthase